MVWVKKKRKKVWVWYVKLHYVHDISEVKLMLTLRTQATVSWVEVSSPLPLSHNPPSVLLVNQSIALCQCFQTLLFVIEI